MAVWHFTLTLAPESGLRFIHGVIPQKLSDYCAMSPEVDLDEIKIYNYWGEINILRDVVPFAERLFKGIVARSDEQVVLGSMYGDNVTLTKEEVFFEFDLRDPDLEVMEEMLRLARRFSCKLIVDGEGNVVDPAMTSIAPFLRNSNALKFTRDPKAFLVELERKLDGR
jgi:hypothetical protein